MGNLTKITYPFYDVTKIHANGTTIRGTALKQKIRSDNFSKNYNKIATKYLVLSKKP